MRGELVAELISLIVFSITEIAVFITNGFGNHFRKHRYVLNHTGEISRKYNTEITPCRYAFTIWVIIYALDVLWIIYAWSFVFRPKAQRTIYVPVYWFRTLVNGFNISWIFLWGNELFIGACVVLYALTATFWISNGILVVYFKSSQDKATQIDRIITWLLPINGMFLYATWVSIASQINLTIVLSYLNSLSAPDSGTIGLSLVAVLVFIYFTLEITIGLPVLQYVYTVYPVVLWACVGILICHWRNPDEGLRNKYFTLILLVVVVLLFSAKIVMSIAYGRLICSSKKNENVIILKKEQV